MQEQLKLYSHKVTIDKRLSALPSHFQNCKTHDKKVCDLFNLRNEYRKIIQCALQSYKVSKFKNTMLFATLSPYDFIFLE